MSTWPLSRNGHLAIPNLGSETDGFVIFNSYLELPEGSCSFQSTHWTMRLGACRCDVARGMSPWELGEGDGRSNKHEELPWGKHTKRRGKWKTIWKNHENPWKPMSSLGSLSTTGGIVKIYFNLPDGIKLWNIDLLKEWGHRSVPLSLSRETKAVIQAGTGSFPTDRRWSADYLVNKNVDLRCWMMIYIYIANKNTTNK